MRYRWLQSILIGAVLALPLWAQSPDQPFSYDRHGDLGVTWRDTVSAGPIGIVDLSYRSPKGGSVPAYLYVPAGPGPHAGIVLMHGMPGSRENGRSAAIDFARRGAVVVAISAPFARPGGPRNNPVLFTVQDSVEQVQLIVDLQRAVDLLLQRKDVDPERLAYVGGSYGGAMGGLLAGVERRLKGYVLVVGDGGLVAHFTGSEDAGGPLDQLPAERRSRWLAAMEPIEPSRWIGRAPPAQLLFQNGRADRLVPAADAARYHEAAGEPKTVIWYDSGHRVTPEMSRDRISWLAQLIGITE